MNVSILPLLHPRVAVLAFGLAALAVGAGCGISSAVASPAAVAAPSPASPAVASAPAVAPAAAMGVPAATGAVAAADTVAPFTRLEIEGALDVTLIQGTASSVRVDSAGDPQGQVRIESHGNTLVVRSAGRATGWRDWFGQGQRTTPRVTIQFNQLTDIEVSGASQMTIGRIATPRLSFDVSGAASVTIAELNTAELSLEGSGAIKADIAGRATLQHVEISGAGDYQAPRLLSERADVEVSGAGKVLINASKSLRVSVSGAGYVDYIGNPSLEKEVSGLGRVRQVQAGDSGPPIGMVPRPASAA